MSPTSESLPLALMHTSRERDPRERARTAPPNPLSLRVGGHPSVTSSCPPLLPPGQVQLCTSSTGGLTARATFPASCGQLPRDPGKEAA